MRDMELTISIITPSFNQGRFIERTIQSVISQNVDHIEYVVMDGGSTDNTVSILKKYASQLQWVSEKDRGQTHAVNKGILATSGEIIGWLNSDDIYYPQAVQEACRFFESNPGVDVLYGGANNIDENDKIIESFLTGPWEKEKLKDNCYISQPTVFFRRRIVEKLGLLDEDLNYCMDYEYWLRLGFGGAKFAYLPKKLAATRFYAETKTLSDRLDVHKEINDMLLKKFGQVPDRWLFNYSHALLEQKKMNRSNRWLFTPALIVMTFFYSWRWNRKISITMIASCWKWFCIGLKQTFYKRIAS